MTSYVFVHAERNIFPPMVEGRNTAGANRRVTEMCRRWQPGCRASVGETPHSRLAVRGERSYGCAPTRKEHPLDAATTVRVSPRSQ